MREAVAVLAAILAAFALDAWWDNSREEIAAREVLTKVELEYNEALIARAIATNDLQRVAAESLVRRSPSELAALGQDSVLTLIDSALSAERLNPSMGATNAAVDGGLLRGTDLKTLGGRLETWQALMVDLDEGGPKMVDALYDYHASAIRAGVMGSVAFATGQMDLSLGDVRTFMTMNAAGGLLEGELIRFSYWVEFYNRELKEVAGELEKLLEAVRRVSVSVGAS